MPLPGMLNQPEHIVHVSFQDPAHITGGQGITTVGTCRQQLWRGQRVDYVSIRLAGEPERQEYEFPEGLLPVQRITVSDSDRIVMPYEGNEKEQYARRREFCRAAAGLIRRQYDPARVAVHLHGFYYVPLMAAMLPEFNTVSSYHLLLSSRMAATGADGDEMFERIRLLEVISFFANRRIHAISSGMKGEILSLAEVADDDELRRRAAAVARENDWEIPDFQSGASARELLEKRIVAIAHGISDEFFGPAVGSPVPDRVVAWGRVSSEKGFEYLIEAMRSLPDCRLHVLGASADTERDRAEYRRKLLDLGSSLDNATLDFRPGGVRGRELLEQVDAADVVVVPSLYEPFGLVIVEALARGKPVLTTLTTGGRHIMNRETPGPVPFGYLVEADPRNLTDALGAALRQYRHLSPSEKQTMREAARRRADEFRWAKVIERLDSLYADPGS